MKKTLPIKYKFPFEIKGRKNIAGKISAYDFHLNDELWYMYAYYKKSKKVVRNFIPYKEFHNINTIVAAKEIIEEDYEKNKAFRI